MDFYTSRFSSRTPRSDWKLPTSPTQKRNPEFDDRYTEIRRLFDTRLINLQHSIHDTLTFFTADPILSSTKFQGSSQLHDNILSLLQSTLNDDKERIIDNLNRQIFHLKEKHADSSDRQGSALKQSQLEREINSLKESLRAAETRCKFLEEEASSSKLRSRDLNTGIFGSPQLGSKQSREEIQSLVLENRNLQIEIQKREKGILEKETHIEKLKSEVLMKDQENEELSFELRKLKQKLEEALSENTEAKKKLFTHREQNERAEDLTKDLKQQLEALKAELKQAKDNVEASKERYTKLEKDKAIEQENYTSKQKHYKEKIAKHKSSLTDLKNRLSTMEMEVLRYRHLLGSQSAPEDAYAEQESVYRGQEDVKYTADFASADVSGKKSQATQSTSKRWFARKLEEATREMQQVLAQRINQITQETDLVIAKMKNRETDLRNQVLDKQRAIERDYIHVSLHESELKRKVSEIEALERDFKRAEAELKNNHKQEIEKLSRNYEKKLEDQQKSLQVAMSSTQGQQKELRESQEKVHELESSLRQTKLELLGASDRISELERKLSQLQRLRDEDQRVISNSKADASFLSSELETTKDSLTAKENEYRRVVGSFNQLQREYAEMNSELNKEINNNKILSENNNELELLLKRTQASLTEKEAICSELTKQLATVKEMLGDKEKVIDGLNSEQQKLNLALESKTAAVGVLERKNAELNRNRNVAFKELTLKNRELREELKRLSETYHSENGQLKAFLQRSVQEFGRFMIDQVSDRTTQIGELRREIHELKEQIETLRAQNRESEKRNQDLTLKNASQICFYRQEIEKLKESAQKEVEKLKETYQNDVQGMENQLEKFNKKMQETVESYEVQLKMLSNSHEEELRKLKEKEAQHNSLIFTLQANLEELQKEKTQLEDQKQEWFVTVDRLETKIREQNFRAENEANKARIEKEKVQLQVLEKCNEVEALERQLTRAEREIQMLKEQNNGLLNEKTQCYEVIAGLQRRIEEQEVGMTDRLANPIEENIRRRTKESVGDYRFTKSDHSLVEKLSRIGKKEPRSPLTKDGTFVNTSFDLFNDLATSHVGKFSTFAPHTADKNHKL